MNYLTRTDEIEAKQDPGQVHGLEVGSEPEVDGVVFIDLTPDIQDRHQHRVHQDVKLKEKGDNHTEGPVEDQHKKVVSRSAIKDSSFQPQTRRQDKNDKSTNRILTCICRGSKGSSKSGTLSED